MFILPLDGKHKYRQKGTFPSRFLFNYVISIALLNEISNPAREFVSYKPIDSKCIDD